ncbi:soluble lytic murein transglycosylase-like protein [Pseudorhizobium tarimense]|uniref:Soluble lytic murein transglycosylase-like protein n=1 Tax=Pseudorhizobium tarimense TaxID=1079109 RepID=A0ABV2H0R1_9HYPH|nr:lytic transglycosylase domain-containing protein [Pseudorhizobium tarimense]MCJ8517454.1 lytic transglycosylase domain-containing protein [Pseudorhizobium tarimense]
MKRLLLFLFVSLAPLQAGAVQAPDQPKKSDDQARHCVSSWKDPYSGEELCIRQESFNRDLCTGIEHFAKARAVPADFFARLIWRESLFRPRAVSPKGAEGIAQFMPATAKLRGLDDSFDVLAALEASATYLRELNDRFGGYGLAAAAYNAGEARLSGFLAGKSLPLETRAYVLAITGHSVEKWVRDPPDTAAAPLAKNKSFLENCVTLADRRRLTPTMLSADAAWAPWGVQLAAHLDPDVARRLFDRALDRLPDALRGEQAMIVRQTRGNFGYRTRYAARIGRDTRAEAQALCARIKAAGGACTVLRN